ncbi:MAG TPA: creatininase family protein [bacterium]|nr:creatininase family protein [bacterium]HPN42784.1 creatininase family protein [bacterium]
MKKSKKQVLAIAVLMTGLLFTSALFGMAAAKQPQKLSIYYEELTAPEFVQAVEAAGGTCIIPIGVLEKHGPHLALGTDLIDVRQVAKLAAEREYTVIFPQYYFSQIFEAKHQPGAIAYSAELIWKVLQETCDELTLNGFKKIVLVNGHGGNNNFLPYFCQAQLAEKKDYAVILFQSQDNPDVNAQVEKLRKTQLSGHACEVETSMLLSHRPDLAHPERGALQSGADLDRLAGLPYSYTAIWWYAKYPNHYAGDGSQANPEIGTLLMNAEAEQLAALVRSLKKEKRIQELQDMFYQQAADPLKTKQ